MGPLASIAAHLFQHAVMHVGHEMLEHHLQNMDARKGLERSTTISTKPDISFIVDTNGVASMTNEYRQWNNMG